MRENRPVVEIQLDGMTPATLEALKSLGLEVASVSLRYGRVTGALDPELLDEIAQLAEVRAIRPTWPPLRRDGAGSVTGQGLATTRADEGGATFPAGLDGSGVTIGIISDSFNFGLGGTVSGTGCSCSTPSSTCNTVVTGMSNQHGGGSNELPSHIPILDDCTAGSPNCDVLGDEGAALGEILHDLAPGADFLFHSGFNSEADMAEAFSQLANCGAHVIVDDIIWPFVPVFQNGLIAQAAEDVAGTGVLVYTSAGNEATFGIDDIFQDSSATDESTPTPTGADFHDFGGGDRFGKYLIPGSTDPGCSGDPFLCCGFIAMLQWNEPFDSLDPVGDPDVGALSDLDFVNCESEDPADCTRAAPEFQGCGDPPAPSGDPLEAILVFNPGSTPTTGFLGIDHFCGNEDLRLRVVTYPNQSGACTGGTLFPGDFDFEDGDESFGGFSNDTQDRTPTFVDAQIYGHPVATGVTAVGASFFAEIDNNGTVDPPTTAGMIDVEPYSSQGGSIARYFDGDGNDFTDAPVVHFKPDVTGPDGINTSFFGSDIADVPPGADPDTDPNFFGTSASAPHAAAIAALFLEHLGTISHSLSDAGIRGVVSSGLDMESAGVDSLSGTGALMAPFPFSQLAAAPTCNCGAATQSCPDNLALEGKPNQPATPGTINQTFHACEELILGGGDFSGVTGTAPLHIFTDGFESGDTSAWGH